MIDKPPDGKICCGCGLPIKIKGQHGVMARRIRDAFNKGSSLGREARDQEVAELKAKIAGLEGRIQGMLESRALGKGE